ncbi:MAG TPA: LLM class flavin-dependent oxidoreductase, partial [Acidimicrobiales bacterium]|nr:LLM class flavin-dependent oxidoreductase [Acidimicrobiales bacterium]
LQDPHPPLHMGGETDAALRRVADLGQGWYSFNAGPDHLEERLAVLRPMLEQRGRSLDEIEVSVTPNLVEGTGQEMNTEVLRRFAEVGADQVVLTVWPAEPDQVRASFEALAETYLDLAATL